MRERQSIGKRSRPRTWLSSFMAMVIGVAMVIPSWPVKVEAAVADLHVTKVTDTTATVSWSKVPEYSSVSFYFEESTDGGSTWKKVREIGYYGYEITAQATGLNPGTTYQFRLEEIDNSTLASTFSNVTQVSTEPAIQVNKPADQELVTKRDINPITFDVSSFFHDPDGDTLTYNLSVDTTNSANVTLTGTTLSITAVAYGTTTITITATDPNGVSAKTSFHVHVMGSISGLAYDKYNGNAVADATVKIINNSTNGAGTTGTTKTDANGNYFYPIECGVSYKIEVDPPSPYYVYTEDHYVSCSNTGIAYHNAALARLASRSNNITSFSIPGQIGTSSIDGFSKRVDINVPMGTDVTNLVPTFTISDLARVTPSMDVAQDFSKVVPFWVTSEDGTQQQWLIYVHFKPPTPSVNPVGDNDTVITGTAALGTAVYAYVNDRQIGYVSENNQHIPFSMTIPKQPVGTKIKLFTETDIESDPIEITVYDNTPPSAPIVNPVSDHDTVVTGKAEANSTVKVYDASHVLQGSSVALSDGSFSVTIPAGQSSSFGIYVTATDAIGNVSAQTLVNVKDLTPPVAPVIDPITDNDTTISGTAEPMSQVRVGLAQGLYSTYTSSSGKWTLTLPAKQQGGDEIYAFAVDNSNNMSPYGYITVLDTTPPAAPQVAEVGSLDTSVRGHAEANTTITVSTSDGVTIGQGTATNGAFTVAINAQPFGSQLNVTATDAGGNVSTPTVVTVTNKAPMASPKANAVGDSDTQITGTAPALYKVTVQVDTQILGTVQATSDGTFSLPITPWLAGTVLTLTATDGDGYVSSPSNITVLDKTPPVQPIVQGISDQDTQLIGTAESGSVITVYTSTGEKLYTDYTKSDGTFSLNISLQPGGSILSITATDTAGNVSTAATVTVADKTPPAPPNVYPVSDRDMQVKGTAEAGARIQVISAGVELGTSTADGSGVYVTTIPQQKAGSELKVTATDADGNVSEAATITVADKTAPDVPTVNSVSDYDVALTGQAEPFSTVTVKNGSNLLGRDVADANGDFAVTILPQRAGAELSVTATDVAGNVSEVAKTTVLDRTAPSAPKVNPFSDHDTTVTGTTESGAKVEVTSGGITIGQATADENGTFTITIPQQKAGSVLKVTATDADGNVSEAATITVADKTAPDVLKVNSVSDHDVTVTGQAEPFSTVIVKNGSNLLGTGVADANGNFAITILPQRAGIELSVTATDVAGNESEVANTTVLDRTAPSAPKVNPFSDDDTTVTGTTESGAKVEVTSGGTALGHATADENGAFTITIPQQKAGSVLKVTATDADGNVSEAATITVADKTAPDAPNVNSVSDHDVTVTGQAEPFSTVTVKNKRTLLGTGVADATGNFAVKILPQRAGTELSVTATDVAGNESDASNTTILDRTAPSTPYVNPISDHDTTVTGMTESGAKVEVTSGGTTLGQATADENGAFTITIPQQQAGSVLNVTATDADGNVSEAATITVADKTAPDAPQLNPVNDKNKVVSGTAEVGATVKITVAGHLMGTGVVGQDGTFSVLLPPIQAGMQLSVTVTDTGGNESSATTVTVDDATPPVTPVIDTITNIDKQLTGHTEKGATVTVSNEEGVLGTATAGTDGSFTVTIPKQASGQELTIIASDAAGNVSAHVIVVVKKSDTPEAPQVNPVKEKGKVTGTAAPGTKITVKKGNTVIGTGTVQVNGTFSINIPSQTKGTVLAVTATNTARNLTSEATIVTVLDGIAPVAPKVQAVKEVDTQVSGTTEVHATVSIFTGTTKLGEGQADDAGNFVVSIAAQKVGTKLTVTVADEAGNVSPATTITVLDGIAPHAPTVNTVKNTSTTVTGTAEANAKITILAGTTTVGSATTSSRGTFTASIRAQVTGTELTVYASDAVGNKSEGTTVTVIDGIAPKAPVINAVRELDTHVSGTTEANATVNVFVGTTKLGEGIADAAGHFDVSIEAQPLGTRLSVTATDDAGNTSPAATTTVLDGKAPNAPVVNPVKNNTTSVTGTAEANAKITILSGTTTIGTTTSSSRGSFTASIRPQAQGTILTVYATDKAGNQSEATTVTVIDGIAPKAPSNSGMKDNVMTITGLAEPGSTVEAKMGTTSLGQAVADDQGVYSITLDAPLTIGTRVSLTATDAAGNVSSAMVVTVTDGTPPSAPVITKDFHTGDRTLTGQAEAKAKIKVYVGTRLVGSGTVGSTGTFTITLTVAQPLGTELLITATDAAGNISDETKVVTIARS